MKKADSFDKETMYSIVKSLLLTFTSALGSFCVAVSQDVNIKAALLIALGTLGSFLINVPLQFHKGD